MRVGITGIFASGKGTVCEMFRQRGAEIIDTDILARDAVVPGSTGLGLIIKEFGSDFISDDGSLKRREFADHIFADSSRVGRLNSILHPIILDMVFTLSSDKDKIYMVNTPLLFESGFNRHMEKTVVVTASEAQVLERGKKRDRISEKEIKDRLKYQIPLNEKIKLADYVIDNSGSIHNTDRQVEETWKILKALLKK